MVKAGYWCDSVPPILDTDTRGKQDLSLKCSAWKRFIPRVQWKSPSPKQTLGPKNFGSEKNSWSEFFFFKNLGSEKILGSEIFGVLKFFGVQ